MALETVYWIALGAGLGLLALSVFLGDAFDFLDVDVGAGDFAAAPALFAAVSAFGAGGIIGIQIGFGSGGSILTGILTGLGAGALVALIFAGLRKQEAEDAFELSALVGERGRLSLSVGPGRTGKVTVTYAGMSRSHSASSDEEIPSGEEVVVLDVIGSSLKVGRRSPG